MRTHLFVAISLLAACKDKEAAPAKEPATKSTDVTTTVPEKKKQRTPTGTPRPQSKLAVTVDGKPVEMATALAWKNWDGTVRVTVSSVPVGCDEVTGDGRWMHDNEVTFDVSFASSLQPDGSMKPELKSTYFSGMTEQKSVAATASGDGSPGQPTTIEVDLATEGASGGKKLTAKGTIDALGCEVKPRADAPPTPTATPMAATITVAGKAYPVTFAKYSKSGDWPSVELFTGVEGCTQVAFAKPSDVTVRMTWFKPEVAEVSQIDLGGAILRQGADQTFDKKKFLVKPVPTGAGEIEVKGDVKVMDFPLKVEGKVTVTECPK